MWVFCPPPRYIGEFGSTCLVSAELLTIVFCVWVALDMLQHPRYGIWTRRLAQPFVISFGIVVGDLVANAAMIPIISCMWRPLCF